MKRIWHRCFVANPFTSIWYATTRIPALLPNFEPVQKLLGYVDFRSRVEVECSSNPRPTHEITLTLNAMIWGYTRGFYVKAKASRLNVGLQHVAFRHDGFYITLPIGSWV